MKILICFAICLFSITCPAQTKLISHRSHSGSNAHFHTAVEHNLFDIGHSNFGIVTVFIHKIDSVVLQAGNKIIILRKTYILRNGETHNVEFTRDTLTKVNAAMLLKANNTDSLKAGLRRIYDRAVVDSTIFIGFDKKLGQKK